MRLMAAFKDQVRRRGLTVDDDEFAAEEDFIRAKIHFEVDLALFGQTEARRNLFRRDPQAQYALSLFDEAGELLRLSREPSLVAAR